MYYTYDKSFSHNESELVIERIKNYFKEKDIILSKDNINDIYDFIKPLILGKVWLVTDKRIPTLGNYQYKATKIGEDTLCLAFGDNYFEGVFPHALYINLVQDFEKNLRQLWKENYLPYIILEEIIQRMDISKAITIHISERIGLWYDWLSEAKNPVIIGQEPNEKNDYKAHKPIGFIDGDRVWLTAPNEYLNSMPLTLYFN